MAYINIKTNFSLAVRQGNADDAYIEILSSSRMSVMEKVQSKHWQGNGRKGILELQTLLRMQSNLDPMEIKVLKATHKGRWSNVWTPLLDTAQDTQTTRVPAPVLTAALSTVPRYHARLGVHVYSRTLFFSHKK